MGISLYAEEAENKLRKVDNYMKLNENIAKDVDLARYLTEQLKDCPEPREEFYDIDHEFTQEEINNYSTDEIEDLFEILHEDSSLYYNEDDKYNKVINKLQRIREMVEKKYNED